MWAELKRSWKRSRTSTDALGADTASLAIIRMSSKKKKGSRMRKTKVRKR